MLITASLTIEREYERSPTKMDDQQIAAEIPM
jgi:hypothetical protein